MTTIEIIRGEERLPIGPFIEWLERYVKNFDSNNDAAIRLHIGEDRIRRWLLGHDQDKRPYTHISLAELDKVTLHTNETIWEIYPDLDYDIEIETAWCIECHEDVTPIDNICPWCDKAIVDLLDHLPERREQLSSPRRRGRAKLRTVRKPVPGKDGWEPVPPPDMIATLRPAEVKRGPGNGRQSKLTPVLIRLALEGIATGQSMSQVADELYEEHAQGIYASAESLRQGISRQFSRRGWASQDGAKTAIEERAWERPLEHPKAEKMKGSYLPEDVLHEAAWLYYYDGLGFELIGRRLYCRAPWYASPRSLNRAIHHAFEFMGWPRRDRVQATRLASYRHGLAAKSSSNRQNPNYRRWNKHEQGRAQPRCRAKVTQGKRKGKRCLMASITGDVYCYGHSEKSKVVRSEALASMRARRDARLIPAEPFAAFLRRLRLELGNYTNVAAALGNTVSIDGVRRYANGSRTTVMRDTVDKALDAYGNGVTTESLYRVLEAA